MVPTTSKHSEYNCMPIVVFEGNPSFSLLQETVEVSRLVVLVIGYTSVIDYTLRMNCHKNSNCSCPYKNNKSIHTYGNRTSLLVLFRFDMILVDWFPLAQSFSFSLPPPLTDTPFLLHWHLLLTDLCIHLTLAPPLCFQHNPFVMDGLWLIAFTILHSSNFTSTMPPSIVDDHDIPISLYSLGVSTSLWIMICIVYLHRISPSWFDSFVSHCLSRAVICVCEWWNTQ